MIVVLPVFYLSAEAHLDPVIFTHSLERCPRGIAPELLPECGFPPGKCVCSGSLPKKKLPSLYLQTDRLGYVHLIRHDDVDDSTRALLQSCPYKHACPQLQCWESS